MSGSNDYFEQYLMQKLLMAYYAGCLEYARIHSKAFPYSFEDFCKEIYQYMLDNANL